MSLLDYQQNTLCKNIFKGTVLREGVKQFIINQIKLFFDSQDIEGCDKWVDDLCIASSLSTFLYTETSDLDVKIIVDMKKFHEYNNRFDYLDDDDMLDKLTDDGRESSFLTSLLPQTQHNLDCYFYSSEELPEEHLERYDSLYSLKTGWIKEPKKISPNFNILDTALEKAMPIIEELDLEIAAAKRNSINMILFLDYVRTLDKDDIDKVRKEFMKLYYKLTDSLKDLVEIREEVKQDRKDAFSKKELETELEKIMGSINYSNENLTFKLLQRYNYMKILSEINEIYKKKIGYKEIKEISKVLQ